MEQKNVEHTLEPRKVGSNSAGTVFLVGNIRVTASRWIYTGRIQATSHFDEELMKMAVSQVAQEAIESGKPTDSLFLTHERYEEFRSLDKLNA